MMSIAWKGPTCEKKEGQYLAFATTSNIAFFNV
jgi:hypothetical protein